MNARTARSSGALNTARALAFGSGLVLAACAAEGGDSAESGQDNLTLEPILPVLVGKPGQPSMLPANYVAMSAKDKQTALWNQMATSEYCGTAGDVANADRAIDYTTVECRAKLPSGGSGYAITALPALFKLALTFDTPSDEMPTGRRKVVHSFASVAKFEMKLDYPATPANPTAIARTKPYTGLLAPTEGSAPAFGIARLSHAGGLDSNTLSPGLALKFLFDGRPSVNTVATFSLDGQGANLNFFANPVTNLLPLPQGIATKAINLIFATAQAPANEIQVKNLASISPTGEVVADAEQLAPHQIWYVPHGDLGKRFSSGPHDFRSDLRTLEPGTAVYDVLASSSATDTDREKLGEITITSHVIASDFGDFQLFFQHPRNR